MWIYGASCEELRTLRFLVNRLQRFCRKSRHQDFVSIYETYRVGIREARCRFTELLVWIYGAPCVDLRSSKISRKSTYASTVNPFQTSRKSTSRARFLVNRHQISDSAVNRHQNSRKSTMTLHCKCPELAMDRTFPLESSIFTKFIKIH